MSLHYVKFRKKDFSKYFGIEMLLLSIIWSKNTSVASKTFALEF